MKGEGEMNPIFTRRSVRKYLEKPVEKELLIRLCEAGMMAPSAHNRQPWQFLVVTDEEKKKALSRMSPWARFASHAPALIVVILDTSMITEADTKWEQDLSAATQNILLECVNQGLGGCWLGLYPGDERVERVRSILDLSARYIPFSVVSLGYPADERKGPEHIYPDRIHFERLSQ